MGQMEACETVLHVLVYLTMHLIAPMSASPSSSHVRNPSNTAQIGSRSCSNCTIAGMLLIARVLSLLLRYVVGATGSQSVSFHTLSSGLLDYWGKWS
ncbi:hypothetical protein RB195_014053 [Necator americanus]|uniref:Secreted protein n=1 Tax=Necator americanus TaxID=51031 RepID=A0ABR1DYW8_NECAM